MWNYENQKQSQSNYGRKEPVLSAIRTDDWGQSHYAQQNMHGRNRSDTDNYDSDCERIENESGRCF